MEVRLQPFQEEFFKCTKRYPAAVWGIGTGKTFMMLLKLWNYCQDNPDSLVLVVRKEFTDLRDSTMKDFQSYFGVTIDSNKEYHFDNGSVVMFRHGAEINVLKNINLSVFAIEQAEEFETADQFDFLRDRLRRANAPYRQGIVVANANGHNWIWKRWINKVQSPETVVSLANTFDNEENLPADFIEDLKRMKDDAPNHYNRFVMNSFEDDDVSDILIDASKVRDAVTAYMPDSGTLRKILAVDVARFGSNETVFTTIESRGVCYWEQMHLETWRNKSLMETTGKIIDLERTLRVDLVVIDDTGLGGGVVDRLKELRIRVHPFIGAQSPIKEHSFNNRRSEAFFNMKELFDKGYIKIINDEKLIDQLSNIRYKYKSNGQRFILSKDEMLKEGYASPDRADALCMACDMINRALNVRDVMSLPREALV